jgi:hypothetical protein
MHSGRANPQQPAPVLISPGSRFIDWQPSATNTQNPNPYPVGIFLPVPP